jgi:hypothetical protein
VVNETSVHKLLRAWCVVRELEHRRCIYVERALVLHLYMYVAHESVVRHHDGHVVRVLVHRRCTCAERESELSHHGEHAVGELEPRLYMNAGRELVRHRCTCVVRVLAHRRCTCAERELGGLLHCDREFHLAFRHPCAVVFRKDSKRHYCALLRVLRRAVIQRGYGHLGREVHEESEIRLLPP